MGNRGQKRAETVEDLPADKRACSSMEFRASSSNSSVQTQMNPTNSTPETNDHDMDTSSSASASSRSEGEHEKDSAYGSCDSDDAEQRHNDLRDYHRRRSSGDHGKFKRIITTLSEETEPSGQLAVLTELCEVLSFCTENSLSSMTSDSLAPHLVKLAKHETNPDIMLLAIRAITYLCDVYPRSSAFLIRHDAVPALCQRLMAIEYLDVAEQCLQALEKISREQALACLQAGAIMAVLSFIEFFSTSIQRVAISTVVNICKKLPSECPSPFMEAVPILCNLLQYEDRQLVENVAVCLIRIVDRVSQSPEMLDELCTHGLIQQVSHLINSNSRTAVCSRIYNGLLGLLVKLSSGSIVAFRTLYELNISSILKNILSTYDLSHGISSPLDGNSNQVYEVLKLLNELLPTNEDQDNQQLLERESFLVSRPELLHKFGLDILPLIIQVVNSGANLCICYGCLSVIKKFIHLSTSDMLVELLKNANISSFLAGVFTRKDPHVLFLALKIVELILQKLSSSFLDSFVKEGVFFAIDALLTPEKCPVLTPEKCSQLTIPVFNGVPLSFDSSQKSSSREVLRCLCFAFAYGRSAAVSERGSCKLENDSVYNLAENIKTNYFSSEVFDCDKTLTDVLQKLRTFSAALSDLMSVSTCKDAFDQHKEECYSILHQVIKKLNGREPISTFEFIESGIVKSLVNYLSDRQSLREKGECCGIHDYIYAVEERLQVFTRTVLYSADPLSQELPILTLIRKLQSALSSLENFPVILSHAAKLRNSFAVVPNGRCTTYPCIRVRFMRGEGETCLCDYSEDVLTVDPFSSMDAIERYLWPKVMVGKNIESVTRAMDHSECLSLQSSSPTSSNPGGSLDHMEPNRMLTGLPVMQEDEVNLSESAAEQAVDLRETNHGASLNETHIGSAEKEVQFSSETDNDMEMDLPASSRSDNSLPKLLFFLEGQQLDRALTLYQAILQQQIKDHEIVTSAKLWSQEYKVTYRRAIYGHGNPKGCSRSARNSDVSDKAGGHFFSSFFDSKLVSDLENSCPTYDMLYLLKILERVNRFIFHIMTQERICGFAEGKFDNLDNLKIAVPSVPQNEFVNSKLTEKLEQQMRDTFAVSTGAIPFWCNQLMASCPFLFSFEARCKYFRLAAFGPLLLPHAPLSRSDSGGTSDRRISSVSLPRKKFLVFRNRILDSAAQMMDLHASHRVLLEVEYDEEVGTGLGPTLEFYTLVSHEFEKSGLGMWREGYRTSTSNIGLLTEDTGSVTCGLGLFPRPWSSKSDVSDGIQFAEVVKRFVLLGQLVAKALQDGRVLDLHFSKAFYKLVLGQELGLFDIQSFDPELGRTLLEFKAIVDKEKVLRSMSAENSTLKLDLSFRNTRIEDLCLDFTLPGYPDYILTSEPDCVVNMRNLEDYISLVVDATINAGISRQVEAFKSGFNQVFPIKHLQTFTEEELEHLLCGEHESWAFNELLDHIKFDHGYTASSPPVISLLEIIQEFDKKERRAFLQFVTGAPRLPPGGLASLNPKLTIVRKHSSNWVDTDLPSVMTCANYLKLPPYSSKERMKEKLLYAITEGQGSFHLS